MVEFGRSVECFEKPTGRRNVSDRGGNVEEHQETEDFTDEAPVSQSPKPPGVARRVFRNRFGHWRAGWRLLLYVLAVFVVGKSITTVLKLFMGNPSEAPFASWAHSVLWVVTNIALLGGALILLRWFDRRPGGMLGLGFSSGWLRELAVGLAAGIGSTGLLVAILVVTRSVSLGLSPQLAESMSSLPRFLFIFSMAAAVEELVFRGYPLQALAEGSRRFIAGALLCAVFTMGHGDNPDVTIVGITNIFLASVVLTVLYFQTRRLWLPIALHLSWNFTQSWLWGFDVSGIKIEDQLFVVTPVGSDLITGGEFGLEGSILSTILFVAIVVWFLAKPILRPTAEVTALWARYPAGFGLEPKLPSDDKRGGGGAGEQGCAETSGTNGEPDSRGAAKDDEPGASTPGSTGEQ
jgi:membrane protease YdiL (CAAX protease family)